MNDELLTMAREAGESHGTAHQKICSALESAASRGLTDYQDATIVSMRTAFAEACAANGTTKKNGLGLFARAWDAMLSKCGLQPRPRTGKGRNGGSGSESADGATDETGEARGKKAAQLTPEAMAKIKADAIRDFCERAKIGADLVDLGAESWVALKSASPAAIKDAQYALRALTGAIARALEVAGIETQDALAARVKAAGERGAKVADSDAKAPKSNPSKGKAPKSKPGKATTQAAA